MPVIAERQSGSELSSIDLPVHLLVRCDEIADRGAAVGRAGREFNAFTIVSFPADSSEYTAEDLSLMAWAAELGWREGADQKASLSACGVAPAGAPCRKRR